MKKIFFILLIIFFLVVTFFISLFFLEFLLKKLNSKVYSDANKTYVLFYSEKGNPFVNHKNFFLYNQLDNIRISSYFKKKTDFINEYSYVFKTNNIGLKQDTIVTKEKDYILILGDSAGEGQGSKPWFNNFEKKFNKSDKFFLINGAILGTGFRQWEYLHDYILGENFKIKKVIVIFTSYDIERQPFILKDSICLGNYKLCNGNEMFLGAPKNFNEEILFLKNLYSNNKVNLQIHDKKISFQKSFKNLFPSSYLAYKIFRFKTINRIENQESIKRLLKKYNNNIIFLHVPYLEEVKNNKIIEPGQDTIKFLLSLKSNIILLKDYCNFDPNNDWHPIDLHLNESGNTKLMNCIYNKIQSFIF